MTAVASSFCSELILVLGLTGSSSRTTRRELELLGGKRTLIYKTLVLTGLRKGELASLTVGHLHLDHDPPYLVLNPADEKNREGNAVALWSDLAVGLRAWLVEQALSHQQAAGASTAAGPG